MKLYFDCSNGISGDMSSAALIDLGADRKKLEAALDSLGLEDEFSYEIKEVKINSIKACDFRVIYNESTEHTHLHKHHRNLEDINKIIDKAQAADSAKALCKKIFSIVAQAESKVHGLPIEKVHFHEIGAIDSIVDILSFSVLFDDINPKEVYMTPLSEGQGTIKCAHGTMSAPVPAVCEIVSKYALPIKITDVQGEMITPTGAAIAAAIYQNKKLQKEFIIKKTGSGAGKRPYPNPVLRVFEIE